MLRLKLLTILHRQSLLNILPPHIASTACNPTRCLPLLCCYNATLLHSPSSHVSLQSLVRHYGKAPPPMPVAIDPTTPAYTEPAITHEDLHKRAAALYVDPATVKHTAPCSIVPFPDGFDPQQQVPQYKVLGKVTGPYRVDRKKVFAIVRMGASQFKVTPTDSLYVDKMKAVIVQVTPTDLLYVDKMDADVNDVVALQHVLMLGTAGETVVGRPLLPQTHVEAVVEEQFRDAKVLNFKKRRRKNSRRLKGHRQPLTAIRIVAVEHGGLLQDGIPDEPVAPMPVAKDKKLRR